MKIAAAQTVPKKEDIDANLEDHYRLVELAAQRDVALIVFPELSITGYVLDKAKELSFVPDNSRLKHLDTLSARHNIIIIAGAPIQTEARLHIGSFIFKPNGSRLIYTKQFLHEGEESYYVPGNVYNPQLHLQGEKISVAICADITHPEHGANAAKANSTIYVAGIFYGPGGLAKGYEDLAGHAKNHSLNVLMANYGGPSCDMPSGGGSAFWASDGKILGCMASSGEGLLIATKNEHNWTVDIIEKSN